MRAIDVIADNGPQREREREREREKSFGWWYAFFVLERVSSFVSAAEKNWGVVGGMNGAVFSLR